MEAPVVPRPSKVQQSWNVIEREIRQLEDELHIPNDQRLFPQRYRTMTTAKTDLRYAVLSDIHANLEGLEAVLKDAQEQKCTHYVCLGDIVGYGPNPNECLNIIRSLDCPVIMGNHDEYCASDLDLTDSMPWRRGDSLDTHAVERGGQDLVA